MRVDKSVPAALTVVLLIAGIWHLGSGLWIQAKAELAQQLIARAWRQSLASGHPVRPWPWADTWPVARLRWRDEVDLHVLAGINGAALPFGPGLAVQHGREAVVLAGHRDTHFAFLAEVRLGDRLTLTGMDGRARVFRVRAREVLDTRQRPLAAWPDRPVLLLVTCYPFDALRAGGALRMVVEAEPEPPSARPSMAPAAGRGSLLSAGARPAF